MKKMKLLSYCLIVIAGFLLVFANLFNSAYAGVACAVVLVESIILFCIDSFTERIGLALFMACMFTFQIGGVALPAIIGDPDWSMGLSNHEYIVTCNCIYASCITLLLASSFLEKYKVVLMNNHEFRFRFLNDKSYICSIVQKWAFIICITSSIVAIAGEWQKMVYAIANGYMSIYGGYSTPVLVTQMQIVSRTSMFVGLAAMPTKKRAWTYFFLGLPVSIMTLIEGTRTGIMTYILFYVYYFCSFYQWRKVKIGRKEKRKRIIRLIVIILIIVFVGAPFLYNYGYTRVGRVSEENSNPIVLGLRFFASQGGSARLIGYAERYRGELPGTCYSLGSIIDRIQGNNFAAYSIESATNTNKFGSIMSYLKSPYNYTVLHFGVGSSYIAEVYYDFGYIGLIVVNIIVACILKVLSSYGKVGMVGKSFAFLLFFYMMSIPRGSLLTPMDNILSKSCLLTVFLVFFLSRRKIGTYE